MQLAYIEFARNVVGIHDADTGEENPACPHKIIDFLPDQEAEGDLGGTLRLGLYPCRFTSLPGTTMIFLAGLPSINFTAPSVASAADSRSALDASAATVILPRSLPLT